MSIPMAHVAAVANDAGWRALSRHDQRRDHGQQRTWGSVRPMAELSPVRHHPLRCNFPAIEEFGALDARIRAAFSKRAFLANV